MKYFCISMSLNEKVLDSYLVRVFNGELIEKRSCKTVYIPVESMNWKISQLKSFCVHTVENKSTFRLYRAQVEFPKPINYSLAKNIVTNLTA